MASTMTEYQARRLQMIEYLGGKCTKCEIIDGLQFDHVDPKTKSFNVSQNWARAWEILVIELNKCQLLCKDHHREKTLTNKEHAGGHNKWTEIHHGTVWAYSKYGCRCDECKAAKSNWYYERKARGVAQFG